MFALSHAWLTPGEPDPEGDSLQRLMSFFRWLHTHRIEARNQARSSMTPS